MSRKQESKVNKPEPKHFRVAKEGKALHDFIDAKVSIGIISDICATQLKQIRKNVFQDDGKAYVYDHDVAIRSNDEFKSGIITFMRANLELRRQIVLLYPQLETELTQITPMELGR